MAMNDVSSIFSCVHMRRRKGAKGEPPGARAASARPTMICMTLQDVMIMAHSKQLDLWHAKWPLTMWICQLTIVFSPAAAASLISI